MKIERRIDAFGDEDFIREGIRAYFLGEGYTEARSGEEGPQHFVAAPRGLEAKLASRIEKIAREVVVRLGPLRGADEPRSVWLDYEVTSAWRLITRLDLVFFRLEAKHLSHYLQTGLREDTVRRLDRVRRPVSTAVMVNVVVAALLVALVGRVAGFSLPLLIGAAVIVALVNLISIVGFADLIVEGMEELDAS
jgi:hypothetical protein